MRQISEILFFLFLSFHTSNFVKSQQQLLQSSSKIQSAIETDQLWRTLWSPVTPDHLRPDFQLFRLCQGSDLDHFYYTLSQFAQQNSNPENSDDFEWTSVSVTKSQNPSRSYLLLGGSSRHTFSLHNQGKVTPRDGGKVYLCEFEPHSSNFGFHPTTDTCKQLTVERNEGENEYLGAATAALELDNSTSLLAYCDPLWRANSKVPVGRCFLQLLTEGQARPEIELADFCQSGLKAGVPCMAGFSVDLSSSNSASSDLKLWVGQPLAQPNGRIQIVSNPLQRRSVTTIQRPQLQLTSMGGLFGYAISNTYVSAPGLSEADWSINRSVSQLFQVSETATDNAFVDWIAQSDSLDLFSGFGTSLVGVSFGKDGRHSGVLVGAPYHRLQAQHGDAYPGRIYLYCKDALQQVSSLTSATLTADRWDDYMDGPEGSQNFGYSFTNLGDLDGDGIDDVAVGAPSLKSRVSEGRIYLIKLLANCQIDKMPIQILHGSNDQFNFGSRLPSKGIDLTFNQLPDLVVPVKSPAGSTSLIYASRDWLEAQCTFTYPPWLSIRRVYANELVEVKVGVVLTKVGTKSSSTSKEGSLQDLLGIRSLNELYHQVAVDLNVTDKGKEQRFRLQEPIRHTYDLSQNTLLISFSLSPIRNVEDLVDIDSSENGLHIAYRFLQSCPAQSNVLDASGECSNGGWLRRPLIDWSQCKSRVPLTRYICYPRKRCESDLALRVLDIASGVDLSHEYAPADPAPQTDDKTSPGISSTINLTYGLASDSRRQILIDIHNFGPTFAGGVDLELQFHGNLRYSRLELNTSQIDALSNNGGGGSGQYVPAFILPVDVAENDTWVLCKLGSLPKPVVDNGGEEESSVRNYSALNSLAISLNLEAYYDNFMSTDSTTNYSLGAGLTISLRSGTLDPISNGNTVQLTYQVVNAPQVLVSYGPKAVSDRKDDKNESAYAQLLSRSDRVLVNDLGPRVEHTFQLEFLGPGHALTNVTLQLDVPIALDGDDRVPGTGNNNYLVYLFDEIRARSLGHNSFEWADLRPKVVTLHDYTAAASGSGSIESLQAVGYCSFRDQQEVVNPHGLFGVDSTGGTGYRIRRKAPKHAAFTTIQTVEGDNDVDRKGITNTDASDGNQTTLTNTASSGPSRSVSFGRIPKEIFQCDRLGYRVGKPKCAQLVCKLDRLDRNRPVLVTLTGWLWARTMFAKRISDLDIVTTASVSQGSVPSGVLHASEPIEYFHLAQTFYFFKIRPKLIHQIPIWPIIVGIVLGLIFLALLIILLYELGFFKRKKPQLRKARYSQGGAEETQRRIDAATLLAADETGKPPRSHPATYNVLAKLEQELRAKRDQQRAGKKREVRIVHPTDMPDRNGDERSNLLAGDS